MRYVLVFMNQKEYLDHIVVECLEKQEAIDMAENLQKGKEDGYYVVMDEELKEVIYDTSLLGGEGL